MNVIFRADASLQMGSGHVMRCLTLADALRERGAQCRFICRAHNGHLAALIKQRGHGVTLIPLATTPPSAADAAMAVAQQQPAHAAWLGEGITQRTDAQDTQAAIGAAQVDWLVVDHYALDSIWERALRPSCRRLMVIDDLADRPHDCDLLLDQTFGRSPDNYSTQVPAHCQLLCGSIYALLRPEFAAVRAYSLQRRAKPSLRRLLITMGGVDKDNATGQVMNALRGCSALPADCEITVVMGATAPWRTNIEQMARSMPWPTRVLTNVGDMAQLMADSDFAIGAAGATSWERCCLGVPTIVWIQAENQRKIGQALFEAGAAGLIDNSSRIIDLSHWEPQTLGRMSLAAAAITDGLGVTRVLENLFVKVQHAN